MRSVTVQLLFFECTQKPKN